MITANPLSPTIESTFTHWGNLQGASMSLALSRLIAQSAQPLLIVTPDSLTASRLEYELKFFLDNNPQHALYEFSDWETLPYDQFSPHQDIISQRLTTLNNATSLTGGAIITAISTLMHRIAPPTYLSAHLFLFKIGDRFNIENIRLRLEQAGYRCVSQVQAHGEFAVRGSLVDLFPMGSPLPFRLDLFDDVIDSIRTFSPDHQRTLEKVNRIELLPAKEFPLTTESIELFRQQFRREFSGNPLNCPLYQEVSEGICPPGIEYYLPFFFEQTASLLDYLPPHTRVILIENAHSKSEEFWREINMRYEQRRHDARRPCLAPKKVFIPTEDLFSHLHTFDLLKIQSTPLEDSPTHLHFSTQPFPPLSLETVAEFTKNYKGRILFCAETTGRREVLLPLLQARGISPKLFLTFDEFLNDPTPYGLITVALDEGLMIENPDIALIAEAQLFGKRIFQRRRRKESPQDLETLIKDLSELTPGAPIVHVDHGVGRYLGLQTLSVGDITAEFLALEYADQDKLYVPITALNLISRYSGGEVEQAPLHKLGTSHWQRTKRKAAEKIRDVAAELLDLYAKRAAHPGLACTVLDGQYEAFAAAFPFEETPDQQRAIQQVLADMASDKPMDRLICGDVGFGKTEVAMRAAFVAVQNNKQVAVLVPTTLLAQQHFQTFSDRFADWPIRVALLSRFKTANEIKKVCEALSEGKIDIVIGTHKLLQQSIHFKSLGLVVIDEEHRFGVSQKERLKSLRASVDILALTATPIPRTLNMAFSGIRDLSIIATPPARRLSIKTFLHEYQTNLIQEAILREILRGGQVYFLHNDITTIQKITRDIEQLVPEARMHFAHGQMRERELEQVMADFYHRRYNVLVSTTIIESGIDIPSANTIIINRADKFGLAQLHQLRGRVGRSHHQAYAYLLIPSYQTLTADAQKRLEALTAHEDLGVGFTLATHDLEIRGAGELLGEGQSGHLQEIGFSLYMDLLNRAVEALKNGREPELEITSRPVTEIDLKISALIPESYLPDVQLRLQYYRKIATATTETALDDIHIEMIDRFGLLPPPAKTLFSLAELRLTATPLGIIKIEASASGGRIEFIDQPPLDPLCIIRLIQTQPQRFKLEGPHRLKFTLDTHLPEARIEKVKAVLGLLK